MCPFKSINLNYKYCFFPVLRQFQELICDKSSNSVYPQKVSHSLLVVTTCNRGNGSTCDTQVLKQISSYLTLLQCTCTPIKKLH